MAEGLFIDVRMFPFPFGIIYSSAIVNYIEMFQFSSDEYRGGSYEYCNCVLLTSS